MYIHVHTCGFVVRVQLIGQEDLLFSSSSLPRPFSLRTHRGHTSRQRDGLSACERRREMCKTWKATLYSRLTICSIIYIQHHNLPAAIQFSPLLKKTDCAPYKDNKQVNKFATSESTNTTFCSKRSKVSEL